MTFFKNNHQWAKWLSILIVISMSGCSILSGKMTSHKIPADYAVSQQVSQQNNGSNETNSSPVNGTQVNDMQIKGTQVALTPTTNVILPLPQQLGYELTASQLITATWQASADKNDTQTQQLPVQLQIQNNQLVLAGFSSWGTRLLSLTYDKSGIQTQVLSGLEQQLPQPQKVLFNLMISLWPQAAWQPLLDQIGWRLNETPHQRQVFNQNGKLMIQIDYENQQHLKGLIHFHSLINHYNITIETLNTQIGQPQRNGSSN